MIIIKLSKNCLYKFQILLFILLLIVCHCCFADKSHSKISCFTKAYADYIREISVNNKTGKIYFHMSNGSIILWNDKKKKSFEERLEHPDLEDMVYQSYPVGRDVNVSPSYNNDPGRFRNQKFLKAVYGGAKFRVKRNLVRVHWLPKTLKKHPVYLLFNSQNGAAAALKRVSGELDHLPTYYQKYVAKPAGTFHWRIVAGTKRLSAHSYGIAIDINTKYSNYWQWDYKDFRTRKIFKFRNRIPTRIVNIFEKNGFIWGGRWYHYDTMHFEYRPELLEPGCSK